MRILRRNFLLLSIFASLLAGIWLVLHFSGTQQLLAAQAAERRHMEQSNSPNEVLNIAKPAFHQWLSGLPDDRITDFGFRNPGEAGNAQLMMPVPAFFPIRKPESLERSWIEDATSVAPHKWIVPVAVGERIVCLVVIDRKEKGELVASEFGKTYAANRLDAGYRLLGWPSKSIPADMRFISFFDPVYELLLAKAADEGWVWINLTGTTSASAQIMNSADIQKVLGTLHETMSAPVSGSQEDK